MWGTAAQTADLEGRAFFVTCLSRSDQVTRGDTSLPSVCEQDVRRRFCKYCPSDIKGLTGEIVRFTNRPLFVITKYLNEAPF